MAKKELLGHVACGCCLFEDAEVRGDKNGNPYVYCPDCNAQLLTHGRAERVRPLLARMRPAVGAPSVTEGKPDPVTEPKAGEPAPAAPPQAAEPAPAKPAKPAAPVKKASRFATLLG